MRSLWRRSRPESELTTTRLTRLLTAGAVTGLSILGMPAAQAVSPPRIDDRLLPKPALPAPPQPTAQREVCAVLTTNPPPGQNQLTDLDLPQVWQLTRGTGQRVAVIDTGVSRHPRLHDVVAGGDYVSTGDGTQDCDAHGTLVAGIIAATPDPKSDGFSGVAPEVTLISIRQSSAKFAPTSGRSGSGMGDVNTMARAVRTAADLGASVINISSVACVPVGSALDDRALGAALAYAVDIKNAVVVAAAGNTGGATQCPQQRSDASWETATVAVSPAWYDDYVLTVGSVNSQGAPSAFTLAGPWVDVAAAGEAATSLGSVPVSGTSYAAPVVAGVAALIRARFPALTARQVMQRIESTAHHPPAGWDALVGHGTVDALAAVSADLAPAANTSTSSPASMPITSTATPRPPDPRARNTAFGGAAICLVALLTALTVGAAKGRLPRPRDGVPGD
jgi:membrane-anchored mycosin MYCP